MQIAVTEYSLDDLHKSVTTRQSKNAGLAIERSQAQYLVCNIVALKKGINSDLSFF